MKNYEYALKYVKEFDLSYENVYKLTFLPADKDMPAVEDVVIDAFTFMEAVYEFERRIKKKDAEEITFTRNLDRDVGLILLFKYFVNIYLKDDGYEDEHISNLDFYDWTIYSLLEIQEAIRNEEYTQCNACLSVVPKEKTGSVNFGWRARSSLCKTCLIKEINK